MKKHLRRIGGMVGASILVASVLFMGQQPTGTLLNPPQVLRGHTGIVGSVAFSPDGKWIASASVDRTGRLWNVSTGEAGPVLQGDTDEVYAVAFAPGGRQLASAGYDHKVIVWDLHSGKALRSLQGFADWSVAIAYSPDGRELAVGSMDGSVTIFDPSDGNTIRKMKPQIMVTALAISPDGRLVATGLKSVVLSDFASGKTVATLEGPGNLISSVAFSPDGRFMAAGSWDKTARLWDVGSGKLVETLRPAMELPPGVAADSLPPERRALLEETLTLPVTGVSFSPDGRLLATAGADKTVRLWDVSTGKEVRKLSGHEKAVTCVAFSPDGKSVVSGSADKTVRIWPVGQIPQ